MDFIDIVGWAIALVEPTPFGEAAMGVKTGVSAGTKVASSAAKSGAKATAKKAAQGTATQVLTPEQKKAAKRKRMKKMMGIDEEGGGEKGGDLVGSEEGGKIVKVEASTPLIPDVPGGDIQKHTGKEGEYGGIEDNIIRIKVKTIAVDKILKGTVAAEKKKKDKERKIKEQADLSAMETSLEGKKKKKKKGGLGLGKMKPKALMSAWQWVSNFFTTMVLGYVTIQLLPLLPSLLKMVEGLAAVVGWLTDWGLELLTGITTLVDWGYKLYDMGMGLVKGAVGEEGAKKIESFMGVLKDLFTGFLVWKIIGKKILDSVVKSITRAFRIARVIVKRAIRFAKNFIKNAAKQLLKIPGAKKVFETVANVGSKVLNAGKNVLGKTANLAKNIGGKVLNVGKNLGGKALNFGKNLLGMGKGVAAKGAGKVGGWAAKIFGKAAKVVAPAMKAAMPAVKGFAKRIPIMGPIIVALVSMMTGDPVGKALFKGVGAALGGALGTFIPIPFLGTLLGETIGVYIGDLLHTLLMGGGMAAAGEKLKQDIGKVLKGGGKIFEWVKGGFSRFITDFKANNKTRFGITNWLALLNLGKTIPLLAKSFFSGDKDAPNLEDEKAARKKEKEARKKEKERKRKEAKEKRDKFVGDVKEKAGNILKKANPLNWFKKDKPAADLKEMPAKTTPKPPEGDGVTVSKGGANNIVPSDVASKKADSVSEYAPYEDGSDEEVVVLQKPEDGEAKDSPLESKRILLVPTGSVEDSYESLYMR